MKGKYKYNNNWRNAQCVIALESLQNTMKNMMLNIALNVESGLMRNVQMKIVAFVQIVQKQRYER
jgi:hypothetical protein